MAGSTSFVFHGLVAIVVISAIQIGLCLAEPDGDDCIRIDAGLTYRGKIYLFHGDEYVKLDETLTERGKGPIHKFGGLHGSIDAAFVYSGNRRTYFFKGANYYRYAMLIVGPYKTNAWDATFSDGLDAAGDRNGKSYLFKGCSIIRVEGKKRQVSETLESEDVGLPCDVDAAFTKDNDLFIIKGNQIWQWGDDVTGPSQLADSITLTSWNLCPASEN